MSRCGGAWFSPRQRRQGAAALQENYNGWARLFGTTIFARQAEPSWIKIDLTRWLNLRRTAAAPRAGLGGAVDPAPAGRATRGPETTGRKPPRTRRGPGP